MENLSDMVFQETLSAIWQSACGAQQEKSVGIGNQSKRFLIGSERECSSLATLEMSLNFGIREKTVDWERLIRRLVQTLGIW